MNIQSESSFENQNGKKNIKDQMTIQISTPSDRTTESIYKLSVNTFAMLNMP